jgi:hypothetical protein
MRLRYAEVQERPAYADTGEPELEDEPEQVEADVIVIASDIDGLTGQVFGIASSTGGGVMSGTAGRRENDDGEPE